MPRPGQTSPANDRPHSIDEAELQELLEEVRRIEAQSKRLVTDVLSGAYSSVFRGAGIAFDEVREYEEGDDPRRVDWNVTARMGRPFVKKFVDEREQSVIFAIDVGPSMDASFGALSARRIAARVVATLALAAVRNGDKVGAIAFGAEVVRWVPPLRGLGHALRIVRDTLALRAPRASSAPSCAFELAARTLRRRSVIFAVSDFLSGTGGRSLERCARRHDVIATWLQGPELAAPPTGLWRVRDPHSGAERELDLGSAAVRAFHAERVEAWRSSTRSAFERAGVDRLELAIPRERRREHIADALLRFFRMRQLRGAKR
ncbi:MAG: DUF58 domain-containing protein [Planctomycetes bacterium]|nr:DUF58 domain-containing protein [Planctomycetota bacterium]